MKKTGTFMDLIVRREGVCGGRPTIKGTRIEPGMIGAMFAHGLTMDEIRDTYPHLSAEQVRAAYLYCGEAGHDPEEDADDGD